MLFFVVVVVFNCGFVVSTVLFVVLTVVFVVFCLRIFCRFFFGNLLFCVFVLLEDFL